MMVRLLLLAGVSFLLMTAAWDIADAFATNQQRIPGFMENGFIEDTYNTLDDGTADSPVIVYGRPAVDRTHYPWVAYQICLPTVDATIGRACGGSLISSQYVLTAAHCVSMNPDLIANDTGVVAARCIVRLGGLTRDFGDESPHEVQYFNVPATDIRRHESYTSHSPNIVIHDIALIRLNPPVTLSPHIQPIALPTQTTNYANARVEIIGWGLTEYGNASSILMVANTTMRDEDTCNSNWNCPDWVPAYISSAMNCYAGAGTEAVCNGDSGTGVITRTSGTPVLVSINSFVRTSAGSVGCNTRLRRQLQDVAPNNQPSSRQQNSMRPAAPMENRRGQTSGSVGWSLWSFIMRQSGKFAEDSQTTVRPITTTRPTTTNPPNLSGCQVLTPSIGVRVSEYLNWITSSTQATPPDGTESQAPPA